MSGVRSTHRAGEPVGRQAGMRRRDRSQRRGLHDVRLASMMKGASHASWAPTARLPAANRVRAMGGAVATTAAKPGRRASAATVAAAARMATIVATAMSSRMPALAVSPITPAHPAAAASTKRGKGRSSSEGMAGFRPARHDGLRRTRLVRRFGRRGTIAKTSTSEASVWPKVSTALTGGVVAPGRAEGQQHQRPPNSAQRRTLPTERHHQRRQPQRRERPVAGRNGLRNVARIRITIQISGSTRHRAGAAPATPSCRRRLA